MPRQSVIWAGVGIFSLALIIYYIYFLDVNECIVEKDGSEEYLESRQDHNKHKNNNNHSFTNSTNSQTYNTTLLECPQINVTSLCANFCNIGNGTTNVTQNQATQPTTYVIGKDNSTNSSSSCVNITYVVNGNFSGNSSCSGGVGYVVPGVAVLIEPRSLLGYL